MGIKPSCDSGIRHAVWLLELTLSLIAIADDKMEFGLINRLFCPSAQRDGRVTASYKTVPTPFA